MNFKPIITALGLGLALTANAATISTFDWTDLCEEMTSSVLSADQLAAITDNNQETAAVTELTEDMTVTFKMRESLKLSNYTVTGDNTTVNGPKSWTIEGSDNGTDWKTIETRSNQSYNEPYWTINRSLVPNSDRDNMASYRYIRFTFPAGKFGLAELQLFGFPAQLQQGITANGGVLRAQHRGFNQNGYSEIYTNLLSDKISTKYCVTGNSSLWVEYVSPKPVKVQSYALTSCVSSSGRDPKTWRFEGFNEETFTWEVLDQQSSVKFTQRFSTLVFPVETEKAYSRLRLSITANNGDGDTQFCKWHIFGTETTDQERIRVACVGNSITENTALSEAEKYPSQLSALLGNVYQVLNYGISERTLLKNGNKPYVKEWKYTEVLGWNPDVVVIDLGTNDSKESIWNSHSGEFVSDYTELVNAFKALPSKPKVFICKPLPAYSNNMNIRGDVIRDEICPKIDEVAAATGATVIDLYAALSGNESLLYDGVHPNASGATIMANVVANAINPDIDIPADMYSTLAVYDWTDRATLSAAGNDADITAIADNNPATAMTISAQDGTAMVIAQLEEGVKLTAYSVTSGTDVAEAPAAWTLQGSNDGTEWTDVDSRSGVIFSHKGETRLYEFSLPDDRNTLPSYHYYRLVMTPADGKQTVNISEWQLLGFPEKIVTEITGNGGVISGEHPGYNFGEYVETVDNLITDNINKKYCASGYYTGWVEYRSMEKIALTGYALISCKDLPNRAPKSWTLQGYNAETNTWETIDERTDCDFLTNHHTLRFDVAPSNSYERIRLNITANKGEVNMQLAKWQLFGTTGGERKIKVACTGNSITANARLDEENRYPAVLQSLLGEGYYVENFGEGGATIIRGSSHPYWDQQKYSAALAFEPDVLVAKFGTNDSNPDNWKKKDQFVNDYVEYINSFKAVNPDIKVILCYPIASWNNTMSIVDETVTSEIIPKIDEVARQTGATVVDLHSPTEGKVYLTYDYVHPWNEGTILMARHIAPAINPEVVLPEVEPGFWQRIEEFDRTDHAVSRQRVNLAPLFDNNPDTEIELGTIPAEGMEIEFELPENFRATGYALTTGSSDPATAPTSWTLQVSADGIDWKDLDSRSNQVFLSTYETNMYQVAIEGNRTTSARDIPTGKYFRVIFHGSDTEKAMAKADTEAGGSATLSEIQLFGANEKLATDVTANGGTITGQYPGFQADGYNETVGNLIDNDIATKYCVTGHKSCWIQYDTPTPVVVDRYSITNANNYVGRNPKSWTLEGSNDGKNWTTLDTRNDRSFMVRLNTVEYPVNNSEPYSHYRLNINENNGDNDLQLAKWQLFKKISTDVTAVESDDEEASAPLYNLSGMPVDKSYKGVVVSKDRKYLAK